MKRNCLFTLCIASAMFASPVVTMSAQEVLPDRMEAVTSPSLVLTTINDINRTKNDKPMVKLANNSLVFSAKEAGTGEELYMYDGNSVKLIKDINPGAEGSNPQWMTAVGNKVYFSAYTPDAGVELWVSDGTEAGTNMVKDIYPGSDGSELYGLTAFKDKLLFFARDEESELDPVIDSQKAEEWLWISDGTEEGTRLIGRTPNNKIIDGVYGYIIPVGDKAFFTGYDLTSNETLWVTDGTEAGTRTTININNKPASSGNFSTEPAGIDWMCNVNDKYLIFRANTVKERVGGTEDLGNEIWLSDGTEAGTRWLGIDFNPGQENGVPRNSEFAYPYVVSENKVWFRAKDGIHGCEPCITDLTPAGTKSYYDINYWNNDPMMDSWPQYPSMYQGQLFFHANGNYTFDGNLYDSGACLWKTDLQAETCIYQKNWTNGFEIFPGNNADESMCFTEVGGRLFFRAKDADQNTELWKMDHKDATPEKVVDFEGSGNPYNLTAVGNTLYFITSTTKRLYKYAPDPVTGIEKMESGQNEVTVYPNPVIDRMTVRSEKEVTGVNVLDVTGRVVLSFNRDATSPFDLSSLSAGLYFVNILHGDNSVSGVKILKK